MTRAAVVAALAGVLASPAVLELVLAVRRPRSRRRRLGGMAALRRVGRGFGARAPRSLGVRVAAAGLEAPVADVMAVKVGGALAGLAGMVPLLPSAPGRSAAVLLVAGPGAGFLGPDLWLARRARRRADAVERELADVLDLLRVAIAAGLAPARAVAEVGRRHPGLLAAELRRAAGRAALGVPRAVAHAELERRCPVGGVRALVAALGRADRHGAPLGPALAAEAAAARSRDAHRATEAAARAAPQIQLVVALLLVPAVLLLVAAALVPAVLPR